MSSAPTHEAWTWPCERSGACASAHTASLDPGLPMEVVFVPRPNLKERETDMRIFSGIQPTGDKTIGNLIGGFRQYAATQERGEGFFCIVDLHSISVELRPRGLPGEDARPGGDAVRNRPRSRRARRCSRRATCPHTPRPRGCSARSRASASSNRMTQFKDKSDAHEFVSAALFTYPVLMAGDILLYQTDIVPIGDDQRQHLELARDVAARFNSRLRRDVQASRRGLSRGRCADHGPAGADEEDVDDIGDAAGDGPDPRRSRRDPEEVQVRGDRLWFGGPARRGQAGRSPT